MTYPCSWNRVSSFDRSAVREDATTMAACAWTLVRTPRRGRAVSRLRQHSTAPRARVLPRLRCALLAGGLLLAPASASAQTESRPEIAAALSAQRDAMAKLNMFDGLYVGTWTSFLRNGAKPISGTTVHRVGPFLGATIKLMEGRNYGSQGDLVFNGMMVMSFDQTTGRYPLRVYANGRFIETEAVMNAHGYHFDVPTPGATSFRRIQITVSRSQWIERVDYVEGGQPPIREAELVLNRVGETDWPLARPNPTPTPPQRPLYGDGELVGKSAADHQRR